MKQFNLVLLNVFLFCGCTEKPTSLNEGNSVEIKVLDKVKNLEENLDGIFQFIDLIPLKKKQSFLLGIDKLVEIDSGFLVLDIKMNSLYLFGQNGEYKYKFGTVGHGPGEYKGISDFFILGKKIFIFSPGDQALFVFKLDSGEFFDKIIVPEFGHHLVPISDLEFLVYVSNNPFNANFNVFRYDFTGKLLASYFPFDPIKSNNMATISGFLTRQNGQIFMSQSFDHKIYEFDSQTRGFIPVFHFDFINKNMIEDRENFDLFLNPNFLINPESQPRFLMNLFLKSRKHLLFSFLFDSKKIFGLQNLEKTEVRFFSQATDSEFIRLVDDPVLLNENDELIFPVPLEGITNLDSDEKKSSLISNIKDRLNPITDDIIYYLVKVKIRENKETQIK